MKEYRIMDAETGKEVVFHLHPDEVKLLEEYAEYMTNDKRRWTVLEVLAYSVEPRGIESLQKSSAAWKGVVKI